MLIKDCFDRWFFFPIVITSIFLLIFVQLYSMCSCHESWQSIANPWYLALKAKSKSCLAISIGWWRLEFDFCLGWEIIYFVLLNSSSTYQQFINIFSTCSKWSIIRKSNDWKVVSGMNIVINVNQEK